MLHVGISLGPSNHHWISLATTFSYHTNGLPQVEELREWRAGQKGGNRGGASDDDSSPPEVDRLAVSKQILEVLRPGETVLKVRGCSGQSETGEEEDVMDVFSPGSEATRRG